MPSDGAHLLASLMERTLPRFSVVIPTFGRPQQLAECLESLACLDYPRDHFEVIVVDDGGSVSLSEVVGVFDGRLNLVLLRQANAGPAAARNTGIARAGGEYAAFTDDDCTVSERWLKALAIRLREKPGHASGGRTVNVLEDNRYARASQHLADVVYGFYNRDPDRACFFASNNFAFPVDSLRAVGAFNSSMRCSEDRELCDRWLSMGYRMVYAPEAVIRHAHMLTFGQFCRQHFGYGSGAFQFYKERFRRRARGLKLRPLHFYARLACRTWTEAWRRREPSLILLIAISQAASAAGLLWRLVRSLWH
jgi:GT2 family glycosyltransferase